MFGGVKRLVAGHSGDSHGTSRAQDRRISGFVRGLTVGAFVGAVIAGSAIWNRRSRDR